MTILDSIGQFLNTYSTGVATAATGLIAVFTVVLAWATSRIYKHSAASERAYIDISHHGPPGLEIDPSAGKAKLKVTVTNRGRTPARVTDMFLDLAFDVLPTKPHYTLPQNHEPARVFLVTQSKFKYTIEILADQDALNAAAEDEKSLWVFGYVDYKDIFGKRHRAGYMRRYCRFDYSNPRSTPTFPVERKNNLIFDPIPGYNYDRRRRWWKREGNDWGDKD